MKLKYLISKLFFLTLFFSVCLSSDQNVMQLRRIHNDQESFVSQLRQLSSNQGFLITADGRVSVVAVHPDWVIPYRHATNFVQMSEDLIRSHETGESFLQVFRECQNRLQSLVILNTGRILPGGDTIIHRLFPSELINSLLTDPSGNLRSRLASAFMRRLYNEVDENRFLSPLMHYIGSNCHIYKRYQNHRLTDVIAAIGNNELLIQASSDRSESIAEDFDMRIKMGISRRNQLIEQFSDDVQFELATNYQDLFGKIANVIPTFRE